MKKIVTVVGARPQFIKAAAVSRKLRKNAKEILVHTGQHYDANMSQVFFNELNIPVPDYNLNIGSASHGEQTAKMTIGIEKILKKEKPDIVLVYGDTNSTLAGALAASKMHIPIAHVEAGLRSYNKMMPEEINRVLTDHISDFLFCPTDTAVLNLKKEGIKKGIYKSGDVMYDAILFNTGLAKEKSNVLNKLALAPKSYILATIHRAENTDDEKRLRAILAGLAGSSLPVVLPLHPRTKKILKKMKISTKNIIITEPLGYLDMISLEKNAKIIATDSGGVQKEAYFMKVPCATFRDETEWVETLKENNNIICGADKSKIKEAIKVSRNFRLSNKKYFGSGNASEKIVEIIVNERK